MSLARGMSNYASAGAAYASEDRFAVSEHVYIPDGDAGTCRAECFTARTRRKKRRLSLSRNFALIYLGVLMFGCLVYLGVLSHSANQLSTRLAQARMDMQSDIITIEKLTETVKKNTDPANICVKAVEFGMVASADENTHHIFLQEIEQFTKADKQNEQMAAAAELPLQSAYAHLSGSR